MSSTDKWWIEYQSQVPEELYKNFGSEDHTDMGLLTAIFPVCFWFPEDIRKYKVDDNFSPLHGRQVTMGKWTKECGLISFTSGGPVTVTVGEEMDRDG